MNDLPEECLVKILSNLSPEEIIEKRKVSMFWADCGRRAFLEERRSEMKRYVIHQYQTKLRRVEKTYPILCYDKETGLYRTPVGEIVIDYTQLETR